MILVIIKYTPDLDPPSSIQNISPGTSASAINNNNNLTYTHVLLCVSTPNNIILLYILLGWIIVILSKIPLSNNNKITSGVKSLTVNWGFELNMLDVYCGEKGSDISRACPHWIVYKSIYFLSTSLSGLSWIVKIIINNYL